MNPEIITALLGGGVAGKYFDLYEEHVELKALLSKKNPT